MAEDKNLLKEWLIGTKQNPGLLVQRKESVEAFARRIGLTRAALYFWLSDFTRPSPDKLAALCKELGVTYEEGLSKVTPREPGRPVTADPRKRRTVPTDQRRKYRKLQSV